MRIGIIGTGAIGGLIAGYLAANDEDVRCFDVDQDIVDAITEDGLYVDRPGREDLHVHPEASTDAEELGTVDVAFLLTKAIDSEQGLADADPMLGPETTVVTIQNGLGNMEKAADHVGWERTLGGYTRLGSNKIEPGRVRELGYEETVFGGEDYETAVELAEVLEDAKLEAIPVEDPEPYIWDKQFLNVAIKPIAALTELRNGPMTEYDETRAAMARLVEEAMAVAEAKGVEILDDDPVDSAVNREMDEAAREKKSSILEDVENRRPTEVAAINGAVADLGDELGVETPYNRLAAQLMKGKEYGYLEQ